ncbi:MAG: threonine/homoserine/homoserine lactone efflux protein [Hyphomicrobiaceae bacterium]|jgi:threonine/homoserine/homoserine lactone efflux protein
MSYIPNPLIIPVGIIIGVAVSAPVGPVNVLCVQRALQRGITGGVAAGLGATLGDGVIAFAAAMGIGAIDTVVAYYRHAIQAIGGFVLIIFGVMLCRTQTSTADPGGAEEPGRLWDYVVDVPKAFLMTVTNPAAVLGLFAIFGGIGTFVEVHSSIDAVVLVGAIMAGSLLWWLILSTIVAKISGRFGGINIGRLNLIAGLALIVFGLVLLSEVFWLFGGRQLLFPGT